MLDLYKKKGFVSSIKIKSVVLTYSDRGDLFERITNDFNIYAQENNLDVELEVSLYTTSNTTEFVKEYGSTLDHLLKKGSKKYDLYFYDVMYSKQYSYHLIDLGEALKKDHIKLYTNSVAAQTCKNEDQWVGLVCKLFLNGLIDRY
ncbi:hypothetical protein PIROE2DRAFT_12376 [Piromyces sp. E2]|nr:hypothetical protein PIROE2DRAFT_12376 [Piromyces sp. E2]|eukprot:OUM61595.1 hypothetical protein PIROE2DRAFT_12376 [Piromyces sp. E2]